MNPKPLKQEGLDNWEIWDVDMALCNSSWAIFDIIRQGIEAIFFLCRVKDEEERLCIHAECITEWLKYQTEALINCIHDPGTIPKNQLRKLLLSSEKTLDSTLRMKGSRILSAESREALQRLRVEVIAVHGPTISSMPDIGSQNAAIINLDPNEDGENLLENSENHEEEEESEDKARNHDNISEEIARAHVLQDIQEHNGDKANAEEMGLPSTRDELDGQDMKDIE